MEVETESGVGGEERSASSGVSGSIGTDWSGVERSGAEWSGVERSGAERVTTPGDERPYLQNVQTVYNIGK